MDGAQVSCSYSSGDTFRDTEGAAYTEDPNQGTSPNRVIFSRHNEGGNGVFLDVHARWLRAGKVPRLLQVAHP